MEDVPDHECALFHFQELARSNDAEGEFQRIHSVRSLASEELPLIQSPGCVRSLVLGEQMISKFNETSRNTVRIFMAVIRLPAVTTDIVISFNAPTHIASSSSSAANVSELSHDDISKVFEDFLRSFCIQQWSLFC